MSHLVDENLRVAAFLFLNGPVTQDVSGSGDIGMSSAAVQRVARMLTHVCVTDISRISCAVDAFRLDASWRTRQAVIDAVAHSSADPTSYARARRDRRLERP